MGAPQTRTSVVIPCLDEAAAIADCVRVARGAAGPGGEVIVADNGSTDGSAELAAAAGARVVSEPRRGYGRAYLAGLAAARGELIVMGDGDLSYDFGEIPRFVRELEDGADLVLGNRMGAIAPGAMPVLNRYLGNPLTTGLVRALFRPGIGDVWCGLRAIRRDALERLRLRSGGMEFALEMVVRAAQEGLDIRELDIELHPRGGESKLAPLRDGMRGVSFLLAARAEPLRRSR
ncbi:MAG TPA: glycosyltransferase family 2 protein [Thermoleophilaceae bacterium]